MDGKNAKSRWVLNGNVINAPKDWQAAEALATFDNDAVQASLSIDKFKFVNAEATALLNHIASGMTGGVGITEGMPFKVELLNNTNQRTVFDGMVDLSDGVEINEFTNEVLCKLKLRDEILALEEKLSALSFGYLENELNIFTDSDYVRIPYIVHKKTTILETLIMSITLYMMVKELIENVKQLYNDAKNLAAHIAGGATGTLAGIIFSIVSLIFEVIYAALLLAAILKLATNLFTQLIPFKRKAKALTFKNALTKVCSHLGYGFTSHITDLDVVCYIPSNFNYDSVTNLGIIDQLVGNKKGVPASSDYGYNCVEFFELAKKLFNGKFAIINGVVNFHNTDDLFWSQLSTYQLPSIRGQIKTYNTAELKANRYLTFDVDFTDEWTIDDYEGTSFEVITTPIVINEAKLNQLKGLDEVRFGACLASKNLNESGFVTFLRQLASTIDGMIVLFGGIAVFQQKIQSTIGTMKIATNNWNKPKVVKVDSNKKLVSRLDWSAKYINNTYYIGRSFVATVNGIQRYGQKEVYQNIKIPFGLNDFVLLIQNSYLNLPDGSIGKITSCKYRFSADYATIDYYIRRPYTVNLQETYVEPTNQ